MPSRYRILPRRWRCGFSGAAIAPLSLSPCSHHYGTSRALGESAGLRVPTVCPGCRWAPVAKPLSPGSKVGGHTGTPAHHGVGDGPRRGLLGSALAVAEEMRLFLAAGVLVCVLSSLTACPPPGPSAPSQRFPGVISSFRIFFSSSFPAQKAAGPCRALPCLSFPFSIGR